MDDLTARQLAGFLSSPVWQAEGELGQVLRDAAAMLRSQEEKIARMESRKVYAEFADALVEIERLKAALNKLAREVVMSRWRAKSFAPFVDVDAEIERVIAKAMEGKP